MNKQDADRQRRSAKRRSKTKATMDATTSNGHAEPPFATTLRRSVEEWTEVDRGEYEYLSVEPEDEGLVGDQLTAFRKIRSMLNGGSQVVKLCGYAGTGKTFLIARLAKWAIRTGFHVTIAAPTHKACGVIAEKLEKADVGQVECRTIHSLLGLKLEPDFANDSGGRILKQQESKGKIKEGLVICDEASMIGKQLKAEIEAVPNVRWVFVGDLAQLPPVGEAVSELLDDPDATLEQVLRQAEDSETLRLATHIRNGGSLDTKIRPGRDVLKVRSAEELFNLSLSFFRSPDYAADASHARMLVFRNDRRRAINQRMRQLVVGKGPEEPFAEGEWLVMYAAFSPDKCKLNLLAERAKASTSDYDRRIQWKKFYDFKRHAGNQLSRLHVSQEVRVERAVEGAVQVADWEFHVWHLRVKDRDDATHDLPVLHEDEVAGYEQVKREMAQAALNAKQARDEYEAGCPQWCEADADRKAAWGVFFTLDETFAQVDYAYAMTTHKAQGSTFDHAFVDVPDLLSAGAMTQRILYTAVTRPSKSLTFYL